MREAIWQSTPDTYDRLFKLVTRPSFLKMEGLGNEVPFFICPYPAKEEVGMSTMQDQLVNRLTKEGVRVLAINLYDLVLEKLQEEDDLSYYLEDEQVLSKEQLKEDLQSILDIETVLAPAIASRMGEQDFDVLFLSGVGAVFPYIRSHQVLNNLQRLAKSRPTLLFFPGTYTQSLETGASLDLFGQLHDDKYYRAFNIFCCES